MRWLFILLVVTVLIYGCKTGEEQQLCLQDYINEVKGTPEYVSIRIAAKDTVSNWIRMDVKFFGHLDTDAKWKIDSAVFFNEDRSKALLLLLHIDTTPTAKLDYVQILAAEKKKGYWYFYAQSMPNITFPRDMNSTSNTIRPFTFDELSEIAHEELIRGFYDKGTCRLDKDFVNEWFKQP